jgi:hypothetical protein
VQDAGTPGAPADYLIFTVATGAYTVYARILGATLRQAGSTAPFVVFTDGAPVPEADEWRRLPWDYRRRMKYSPERWFIKYYVLKELARETGGHIVFMDSDVYARRPFDLGPLLEGPAAAFLEIDLETIPDARWHDVECSAIVEHIRGLGWQGPVRSLNAGLFSVRADAVYDFLAHVYAMRRTYIQDELVLAYAVAAMNPRPPLLDEHREAYDSNAIDDEAVPAVLAGKPWETLDWLTKRPLTVDPALVHYASQKAAVASHFAPGLPELSLRNRLADLKAKATRPTFARALTAVGLADNDRFAVPRRAAISDGG